MPKHLAVSTQNRATAAKILVELISNKASLDTLFDRRLSHIDDKEAGFIKEICFGCARYFHRLSAPLHLLLSKPLKDKDQDVYALMLVGLYQLEYMRVPEYAAISETAEAARALRKHWAVGLVNGVLRNFQRKKGALFAQHEKNEVFIFSHPKWMIRRIKKDWPNDANMILEANNQSPPMALRVNLRKTTREKYLHRLSHVGIEGTPGGLANTALSLRVPRPVSGLTAFLDGEVSVQDEAAQWCTELLDLKPNMRVLDACAAPGGKTCAIAESGASLEIVAIEKDAGRTKRIYENKARLQLEFDVKTADAAELDSWWDGKLFDRVLLDAPCSAMGVVRRHPDIKLLRKEDDVVSLFQQQLRLLENLWQTLHQSGRLLYVTCSILKAENDDVVRQFIDAREDVNVISINSEYGVLTEFGRQLLPGQADTDGFYFSVLEKR